MLGTRDANHGELAKMYEQCFCSVVDTSVVGFGFPDAVIGYMGKMDLVEFKTDKGTFTPKQERFIRDWRGPKVRVIRTRDDVLAHVQSLKGTRL